ncbi:mycofactocin biosynthesis peptidyl-dipeptidase MftE [Nocardia sp. NPDC127579]|uniref:mycofactocin biosynthesis peptidyl-dipeptidase MftE n=1 Tax=Nocardia sp. NPDC127579 TaxID=3345402 RepID=UPI003641F574
MVEHVSELTWPEVGARADEGVILAVPIGSTEQHGPHLPLSTDTDIAVELCRGLAERRPDVLIAPAVPYGSSGEHAGFPGTLSIGQAALELLIVELCRSATDTFERILLVNGHGGNIEALRRAVRLLRSESRDVRLWVTRYHGDLHAGHSETGMQLALDSARVRTERAEPGDPRPISQLYPLLAAGGVRAVSANGVLGDPTTATPEDGARLLDSLATHLANECRSWWPVRTPERAGQ